MANSIDFDKLPKEEQNFRWALFIASNGYEKELTKERIEQLRQKYIVQKQPLVNFAGGKV